MSNTLQKERKRLIKTLESLLEGPMVFLGFVWLVLLVVELVWGLTPVLEMASLVIWLLFIVDFVLKFALAPQKLAFLKRNWLTAVSLLIPALRVFRALRVVRLLRTLRGVRLVRIVSSINRGMRSLAATMRRRAFGYVVMLTLVVTFAGAAGMYALEFPNPGFENFGLALWWTAMRIITSGSDYWPLTPEGRALAFLLALFGYAIFGYVTATLATFFIGRDAEEKDAPVAGSAEVQALEKEIVALRLAVEEMRRALSANSDTANRPHRGEK